MLKNSKKGDISVGLEELSLLLKGKETLCRRWGRPACPLDGAAASKDEEVTKDIFAQ